MNTVARKRLYKAKNHWNVAMDGALMAGAIVGGTTMLGVNGVHADTVSTNHVINQASVSQAPAAPTALNTPANTVTPTVGTQPVAQANRAVQQAVASARPITVAAGGTITPQASQNVGSTVNNQAVNQQVGNISATGRENSAIVNTVSTYASANSAMGATMRRQTPVNVSSMTPQQIESLGQSQVNNLTQAGKGNSIQWSAAQANGGLISNASGIMHAGSAIDVSSMNPASIAALVSQAAAVLSATGSADRALVSASNVYTSAINAVGGVVKRGSDINTADNMTPEEIRLSIEKQIAGFSATAQADRVIYSAVKSALPTVNDIKGVMHAGSAIDTTGMDAQEITSIVTHQSQMVSATASGDRLVKSAVDQNQQVITKAGGQLIAGSHINTANNMTVSQVLSMAVSQAQNINATGSADAQIGLQMSKANQALSHWGLKLNSGSVIDVSSMSVDQIKSLGQSLVDNLSLVVAHDNQLTSETLAISGVVKSVNGKETPGSVIDASSLTAKTIKSLMAEQSQMVSATGSADTRIKSDVNAVTPVIHGAGGQIIKQSNVNTANNMTPAQIASDVQKQEMGLSQAASADKLVGSVVVANSDAIKSVNGKETPGSAINVSTLDPDVVKSLVAKQVAMVNATGSADARINHYVQTSTGDILKAGGKLIKQSNVNTANNMTPDQIKADEANQEQQIGEANSADKLVGSVVVANSGAIKSVNGKETPGSAINVTSLKPEIVKSLVALQVAMVSATGSADAQIKADVDALKSIITKVGGHVLQDSAVNTANNMTVDQIASDVASQSAVLSVAASLDAAIDSLVAKNAPVISQASGVTTPGSSIDITNMPMSEIRSIIGHQRAMVNATASADADVVSHVTSANPDIVKAGGSLIHGSNWNTANNTTVSQIAKDVKSQDAKLSQTASADRAISDVVVANGSLISMVNGKETPGLTIDTTSLSPQALAALVKYQQGMVNATGSADAHVKSYADQVRGDIESAGGTLISESVVNTADNMTVKQISADAKHQDSRMSATAKADRDIMSTVAKNYDPIYATSGVEKPGSMIDTTLMNSGEIASIVAKQQAMVNATGSADADVQSHAQASQKIIETAGGKITQSGTINTANNMNVGEITNDVTSQDLRISATASADSLIDTTSHEINAPIVAVSGTETPGSAIDTTAMPLSMVKSLVDNQVAMMRATASADVKIKQVADNDRHDIEVIGGKLIHNGDINTANNMTTTQISANVQSQTNAIDATASADRGISAAVARNHSQIAAVSGVETPGKAIEVSSLTLTQLASLVAYQEGMVDATGSADVDVKEHAQSATNDITKVGGTIKQDGIINTADNMTIDQITSGVNSQDAKISQTASGDRAIASVVAKNGSAISAASGVETPGSTIDVTYFTPSEVLSIVDEQVEMVNATGSADSAITSVANEDRDGIKQAGGFLNAGSDVNTANDMTPSAISQHVALDMARISAVLSADRTLARVASEGASAMSAFKASFAMQSASDVTSLQASAIEAIGTSQALIMSQVVSDNAYLASLENHVSAEISLAHAQLTRGANIDVTAMNQSQIVALTQSQAAVVSAVGVADAALNSALRSSAQVVSAGGTLTAESAVDVKAKKMTASQIVSEGEAQASNVSATISADGALNEAVAKTWSQTTTLSSAIDVSSWSPKQIHDHIASELTAIGETQNANVQLSTTKSATHNQIERIGGRIDIQSVVDTTSMTSAAIASMVASQTGKLTLTAADTDLVSSAVVKYSLVVMGSSSAVDTTDPSSSAVLSEAHSQVDHISHTSSMDQNVRDHVSASDSMVKKAGGSLSVSGIYDTTMLTESTMTSWTNSEDAHLSHVGSNDSALTSTLESDNKSFSYTLGLLPSSGAVSLGIMKGSAISNSAIDVTDWTDAKIDSFMASQIAIINSAASADVVIESERYYAQEAGVITSISQVPVSDAKTIASVLASMSSATNSAVTVAEASDALTADANMINYGLDGLASEFKSAGGHLDPDSVVNVDLGQDWHTVWANERAAVASLEVVQNSIASGMRQAIATLNYISHTANPGIDKIASQARQTPNLQVNVDVSDVRSVASVSADFVKQQSVMSNMVASQIDANNAAASLGKDYGVTGPGHTKFISELNEANKLNGKGAWVHKTGVSLANFPIEDYPTPPIKLGSSDSTYYSRLAEYEDEMARVTAANKAAQQSALNHIDSLYASEAASMAPLVSKVSANFTKYSQEVAAAKARINGEAGPDRPGGILNNAWQNLAVRDLGNGMIGVGVGQIVNGNLNGYHVDAVMNNNQPVDKAHIITQIQWPDSVAPYSIGGRLSGGRTPGGGYGNFRPSGQVWNVDSGTVFVIPGIVHMLDGSTHNLVVQLTDQVTNSRDSRLTVWNQNGAINYVQDRAGWSSNNRNWVNAHYWVDSQSNNQNYLWINAEGDIDGHQRLTASGALLSVGGHIQVDQTVGQVNIISAYNEDLHGFSDAPNGVAVYAHFGPDLNKTLADTGQYATTVADADFGPLINVNVPTITSVDIPWQDFNIGPNHAPKAPHLVLSLHKYKDDAHYPKLHVNNTTQPPHLTADSLEPVYQALSSTYNKVRTKYHAYHIGVTDHFNYKRQPFSTKYHPYSSIGNHRPQDYKYVPMGTEYDHYSTDGKKIAKDVPPVVPDPGNPGHWKINPKFTGYAPLSVTWQGYQTDGKSVDVPPLVPDPKHPGSWIRNPKFTGYTPFDADWQSFSTDGQKIKDSVPSIIPDPKNPGKFIVNPKFTGYTPWSTTWHNYETDGKAIAKDVPPMIKDKNGHWVINPKFTGYTPFGTTWHGYETNGKIVHQPPLIPDGFGGWKRNPKFTGYTPYSMTWHGYDTDGKSISKKVPPLIPDGHGGRKPNPKFTGYTPFDAYWHGYSTDGKSISKDVPPLIPDPNRPGQYIPNPKFTGYTPWDAYWHGYDTDGKTISKDVPPLIPDPDNPNELIPNPKFTGYTPWDAYWHGYDTDGKSIEKTVPPMIPDPNNPGQYIPNPKFTGYAPMNTKAHGLTTTYHPFDSDGKSIAKTVPPMIPDPNNPNELIPNPKFTGYTPFNYTYHPYSDDGTRVPSRIPDGHGGWKPNPRFTGYRPLDSQYHPMRTTYVPYAPAPEKPGQPVQPQQPGQPQQPTPQPQPGQPLMPNPVVPESQTSMTPLPPVTPAVPVMPAPAPTPAATPAPAPQPALQPASQQSLPQTGYARSQAALVGLAGLALLAGLGLAKSTKRRFD